MSSGGQDAEPERWLEIGGMVSDFPNPVDASVSRARLYEASMEQSTMSMTPFMARVAAAAILTLGLAPGVHAQWRQEPALSAPSQSSPWTGSGEATEAPPAEGASTRSWSSQPQFLSASLEPPLDRRSPATGETSARGRRVALGVLLGGAVAAGVLFLDCAVIYCTSERVVVTFGAGLVAGGLIAVLPW